MDIQIRDYSPNDEENIVPLLELIFPMWPPFTLEGTKIEHWRWKYLGNPLKSMFITVVEKSGKIIGVNHALFVYVKIGESRYRTRLGYDMGIHPDYRGMKLWTRMKKYRLSNPKNQIHDIKFNLTGNQVVKEADIKEGNTLFPKEIQHFLRIQKGFNQEEPNMVKRIIKKIGYRYLMIRNTLLDNINELRSNNESLEIVKIKKFDDTAKSFWDKVKNDYDFIIERTQEYLNWRYCDVKGGGYLILKAVELGNMVGFIVFRVNNKRPEHPVGVIVDLMSYKNRSDITSALLKQCLEYFTTLDVVTVSSYLIGDHPDSKVFTRFGFIRQPFKSWVFLGPEDIGKDRDIFLKAPSSRLHFHLGDTDLI
jgi:hypothetical protein